MKALCLLILAFVPLTTTGRGMDLSDGPASRCSFADSVTEKESIPRGLKRKRAGRILTFAGMALFVGGYALALDYNQRTSDPSIVTNGTLGMQIGAGNVMMITGAILWASGSKEHRKFLQDHPGWQMPPKKRRRK